MDKRKDTPDETTDEEPAWENQQTYNRLQSSGEIEDFDYTDENLTNFLKRNYIVLTVCAIFSATVGYFNIYPTLSFIFAAIFAGFSVLVGMMWVFSYMSDTL